MSYFTEITAQELKKSDLTGFFLIDVRSVSEYQQYHLDNSVNIPLDNLLTEIENYQISQPIIMICRAGIRSKLACQLLLAENKDYQLYNLSGGLLAWQNS